jgi:hypothetical protein
MVLALIVIMALTVSPAPLPATSLKVTGVPHVVSSEL